MKKVLLFILSVLLVVSIAGCAKKQPKEEVEVKEKEVVNDEEKTEIVDLDLNVAGLKGPTSMGMIKLFEDYTNPSEGLNINYTVESAPDLLVGKLIKGELDIATVPTNLASIIYNKTKGKYKLVNINTLNVMYIMTDGAEINSIKDLKDETLYISGKGATPDFVTRYLIEKNGLIIGEDINVDFSLDHSSLAQAINSGEVKFGVLPQPFVTTLMMKNSDVKIGVDLQKEWEAVEDDSLLALGGLLVKTELIENHPEIVNNFLDEYKKSVEYVNSNPKGASILIEKFGILPKAKMAEMAIPKCNIVYKDAKDIQNELNEYYKILFDFNPKSVGGKLPDDEFYYKK